MITTAPVGSPGWVTLLDVSDQEHTAEPEQRRRARWSVIRDLAVFQVKLALDGLKDLVLAPLTFVAALVGLFTAGDPGRHFYRALDAGRRFDRWVNLYGDLEDRERPPSGLDRHVNKVEQAIQRNRERGGAAARSQRAIDGAFDRLDDARRRRNNRGRPT